MLLPHPGFHRYRFRKLLERNPLPEAMHYMLNRRPIYQAIVSSVAHYDILSRYICSMVFKNQFVPQVELIYEFISLLFPLL